MSHYPIITILDFQLSKAIKKANLTQEQDDNINGRELMEQLAAECEDLKYEVYKKLDEILQRYKTTGKYEPESIFQWPNDVPIVTRIM